MDLNKLIENEHELNFNATDFYTTIIGLSPSRGARSPSLWNKVFRSQTMSAMMHAVDVQPKNLEVLIDTLRNDSQFLGGAVAVPYKAEVMNYLDAVEPSAKIIGAVNCIYRNSSGQLVGANTDGEGAIKSLEKVVHSGILEGSTVLVIGIGGAGHAVATSVADAIGPQGRIVLSNRTREPSEILGEKLRHRCFVDIRNMPPPTSVVESVDVIINCSTVGYQFPVIEEGYGYSLQPYTALSEVDTTIRVSDGEQFDKRYMERAQKGIEHNIGESLFVLSKVKSSATIFDIIYQPQQTMLLKLASCFGLSTFNGLEMNVEQAVLAFCRVMPDISDKELVRNTMQR